ncbi:hypothetical protein AMTRI_Chr08g168200 [Amborella trichopoda]
MTSQFSLFRSVSSLSASNPVTLTSKIKTSLYNGLYKEAIESFLFGISNSGQKTDKFIFPGLLKACTATFDLNSGEKIHHEILQLKLESDPFIASSLINMYSKCGCLDEALIVFNNTSHRDMAIYNAMIDGYFQQGFAEEGAGFFREMQSLGIRPDGFSLSILLGGFSLSKPHSHGSSLSTNIGPCDHSTGLHLGKQIHGFIIRNSMLGDPFLGTNLMGFYFSFGDLNSATNVFHEMPERNFVSWNTIIGGLAQNEGMGESLEMFKLMMREKIKPGSEAFSSVLTACSNGEDSTFGSVLHCYAIKHGLCSDSYVSSSLINMYGKFCQIENSWLVFNETPLKELGSWNSMISSCIYNNLGKKALELYKLMKFSGAKSDCFSICNALSACNLMGFSELGRVIHGELAKKPVQTHLGVRTALLTMYSNHGKLEEAMAIFNTIHSKDLTAWGAMIAGFCKEMKVSRALNLMMEMELSGLKPDSAILTIILSSCASLEALALGTQMHGYIMKSGFSSDIFVGTAIIDMYAKCGLPEFAGIWFSDMKYTNLATWNAIICGFYQNSLPERSIELFMIMVQQGLEPDYITIATLISATARLATLKHGKSIHGYIIRHGFCPEFGFHGILIDMYIKCGSLRAGRTVFNKMPCRERKVFDDMNQEDRELLERTSEREIRERNMFEETRETGREVLSETIQRDRETYGEIHVCQNERGSSDRTPQGVLMAWNAMISGCGSHGKCNEALELFEEMKRFKLKPDGVTFLALISACSHGGLVKKGLELFQIMSRNYGTIPKMEHYACIVDLLSRAGQLEEAYEFIESMPVEPDSSVWASLLGSCRVFHNLRLGELAGKHLIEMEPNRTNHYVQLMNIYAEAGMRDKVAGLRGVMREKGLRKRAGCSWIEAKSRMNVFVSMDTYHPEILEVYGTLVGLVKHMEEEGYVPLVA